MLHKLKKHLQYNMFNLKTKEKNKEKNKEEKYLEIDAVREAFGSYINFDAIKNATLLAVTRENINEDGNDSKWRSEHTLARFVTVQQSTMDFELSISRHDHELLITKLNNTK